MSDFSRAALLVVDAQCGFSELCPDELSVPGALAIVPEINRLLELPWARIDASVDWHPPDHCSFRGQRDNLYPPHCVAGTPGAAFLPGLASDRFQVVWRKGYQRDFEAYALTAQHPGYVDLLRGSGITSVAVCGIAMNICCFFVARDLRRAGFTVCLVEDASVGIDIPAANLYQNAARAEGQSLGIHYLPTASLGNVIH
jgi:nicotinamidase/pyrazinamidase